MKIPKYAYLKEVTFTERVFLQASGEKAAEKANSPSPTEVTGNVFSDLTGSSLCQ